MLRRLHARPTYADVMATVAVFIALGGSSYAALRITGKNVPNNALTGADITNLTGKDVRNNSLTGADVKSLTGADVANGRLLAEDFAPGQLPRGPKGERGEQGPPGLAANQTLVLSAYGARGGGLANAGCIDLDQPSLVSAVLDLPLPAGAVITQVRARYLDTANQDIQFGLELVSFDGSVDQQILASGGSSNSPSEGISVLMSDPGTVFPAVSDRTYYYLWANPITNHTGQLLFCGAAVDYTLAS